LGKTGEEYIGEPSRSRQEIVPLCPYCYVSTYISRFYRDLETYRTGHTRKSPKPVLWTSNSRLRTLTRGVSYLTPSKRSVSTLMRHLLQSFPSRLIHINDMIRRPVRPNMRIHRSLGLTSRDPSVFRIFRQVCCKV